MDPEKLYPLADTVQQTLTFDTTARTLKGEGSAKRRFGTLTLNGQVVHSHVGFKSAWLTLHVMGDLWLWVNLVYDETVEVWVLDRSNEPTLLNKQKSFKDANSETMMRHFKKLVVHKYVSTVQRPKWKQVAE